MNWRTSPIARFSIIATVSVVVACADAPRPVDPAYQAEIEEWRTGRLERLTADDGWLSLTGLYWLEPGSNSFGSGEENAIVIPDATAPGVAGQLVLGPDGAVTAVATEGSTVMVNGAPVAEAQLKPDIEGQPDVVTLGRVRFYIIDRDGRMAARVKDPEAPTRSGFTGIEHFPIDRAYRVTARLEPYETPQEAAVPTVLGEDTTYTAPGMLHFTLDGTELTLEPYLSGADGDSYFLIFRDATSGVTTYGAGRFLYASAVGDDGTTTLDFNLAYNPPCAFTAFATCPLPPPQNWLQAPIEAGEKYAGEAH